MVYNEKTFANPLHIKKGSSSAVGGDSGRDLSRSSDAIGGC